MFKHSRVLALLLAVSFVVVLAGVAQQQAEETVVCPVSGKEIKKSEAKTTYEHEGKMYYFCCEGCKEKFIKDPEKYLQKKEEMKEHEKMMHMQKEGKSCCAMMGMMGLEDVEMNFENLENGIAVKITSQNAETVKKLQEHAAKMKEMCAKQKEAKKEEAKK